jgi:hypothetical protein
LLDIVSLKLQVSQMPEAHTCNPSYLGSFVTSKFSLANSSQEPHLQNNQSKINGCVAPAVEHLLHKHKALNSNPSPQSHQGKKKKKTSGESL